MSNPPPYPNPPAGAYNPQGYPPAPGYAPGYPPAPSYQGGTYYQQPVQQVVYVEDTSRRDAEDAECCMLACLWTLLCCCFLNN